MVKKVVIPCVGLESRPFNRSCKPYLNLDSRFTVRCPGMTKRGFTLIELLVVVLIIGILASVALPQYQVAVLKARFKQMDAMAIPVHRALQMAYLESGNYPVHFDELDISLPPPVKLETSDSGDRYVYKWGYCHLRASSLGNIQCQMSGGVDLGIEIFADGTKYCFTSSSFSAGNKVCRMETGNPSGVPGATAASFYKYL